TRLSRHNASPSSPPGPVKHEIASGGIPHSNNNCVSLSEDKGVFEGGFITTAFPPAIAGATLWTMRFSGKLNGLMATTTPHGTRNVNPILLAPPGDASSGTVSPWILRASSA